MDANVDQNVLRSFQEEVRSCLPDIRERLRELHESPGSREPLEQAHRLIQSIGSAASMIGLAGLGDAASTVEQYLGEAVAGQEAMTPEAVDSLSGVLDEIESLISGLDQESEEPAFDLDDLLPDSLELDELPAESDEPLRFEFDDDGQAESPAPAAAAAAEPLPEDETPDDEMLEIFQEEAEEHLTSMAGHLRELESDPNNRESLQEVRRSMHTIKGAAGMVGLKSAQRAAHRSEDLLDAIYEGQGALSPESIALLYETADVIEDIARAGGAGPDARRRVLELTAHFEAGVIGEAPVEDATGPLVDAVAESEAESLVGEPPEPDLASELTQPGPNAADLSDEVCDDEMLEVFQEEAEEHLGMVAENLRGLRKTPDDRERLQEVRRSMHTLKGAAGMVGLRSIQRVAHRSEDLLDRLYENESSLSEEAIALLQQTADVIEDISGAGGAGPEATARVLELSEQYGGLLEVEPCAEVPLEPADLEALEPADLEALEAELPVEPDPALEPADAASARIEDAGQTDSAVDPELLEIFQEEAAEHLGSMAENLRELEKQPDDRERLQEVRRSMHTLKGAAGMVGLRSIQHVAHRSEDLLDRLYDQKQTLEPEVIALLAQTADLVEDIAGSGSASAEAVAQAASLIDRYEQMLAQPIAKKEGKRTANKGAAKAKRGKKAASRAAAAPTPAAPTPATAGAAAARAPEPKPQAEAQAKPASGQYARVPLERVEELVRLVSELIVSRSAFEQHSRQFHHETGELGLSAERLKRLTGKLEADYAVRALHQPAGGSTASARPTRATPQESGTGAADGFDDLEFDRYSEFHLLTRDLAETTADVTAAGTQLRGVTGEFQTSLTLLSRLTSEVQDGLMRLRMSPVSSLDNRLYRTVRVAAQATGKKVRLEIEGGEVELDKTVIEEMTGPFEHLLRNAVDHGVETPDARAKAGKPGEGVIRIRAYLEGARAAIEISDDGAGLNPEALREKAVERGIHSLAQAQELSDERTYELIFHPGFSTAKQVSEVSGRGVGMDVVRSTIQSLNGSLSIRSERGVGSTFVIRLPTTLAVARVVKVEANGQMFAAPVHAIRHVQRLQPEQLERTSKGEVVHCDGRIYPAIRLADALCLPGQPDPDVDRPAALIVEAGERSFVVLGDYLHEADEVVVKSLGGLLKGVHGINAATISGDGSVVLILNPAQLADPPPEEYREAAVEVAPEVGEDELEILVVDDSLSVRRVVTRLLEAIGWKPIAARDGQEALEMLKQMNRVPDAVLLDVEMPRMDGYGLTAELRSRPEYAKLPIVMLTSRAGKKHRTRAADLGVDDYLVKPFQEEALTSALQRVVDQARDKAAAD